jgi:chromosome segregation ATPase
VSELREKIADLVDAISRNEVSEPTDAVLRVLAEHGGVTNLREQISLMVWRSANERAERAEADLAETKQRLEWTTRDMRMLEADLAAARQQLDQVRALAERQLSDQAAGGDSKRGWIYAHDALAILDAPARPAGHDETGQ